MAVIVATAACHNLAIDHDYVNNHLFPEWLDYDEASHQVLDPLPDIPSNDRRRRQLAEDYYARLL